MRKKPSLVLREPVRLYADQKESKPEALGKEIEAAVEKPKDNKQEKEQDAAAKSLAKETIKLKKLEPLMPVNHSARIQMSPRIGQIWDYFCTKAVSEGNVQEKFTITRAEVMKEAGVGSTNTYRDALRKFQELELIEIELRPGVNSGSIFTLTEKGQAEVKSRIE